MSTKRFIGLILVYFLLCSTAQAKSILVYGDSLSAAYGLDLEQGWVHLLSERLAGTHKLSNASVSGETSAGGLARLPSVLKELKPDLVLLELGANDGLRGYSPAKLEQNIAEMVELILDSGAQVVVFGITLPASYGPRYIDAFENAFKNAAKSSGAPFYDFVVDEFIGNDQFIQPDGLHPTAQAQPIVEAQIYRFLEANNLLADKN